MRRKICSIVLIFICILTLSAGCGSKNQVMIYEDPGDRETTTITFFGNKYEPENVTVIEEIISDFMADNPDIRVSYESLKGSEYYEALGKRMESGRGDDVFMVNHDILLELDKRGQVADLSELSSIGNFTEQMLGQMETDGKITWIPTTVSVFGLYCNMDLLHEHGQEIPRNLQEWEAVCEYFVQKGITPVVANNDISLKTLAIGRGFYSVYAEGREEEVLERLNSGGEQLSEYLTDGFAIAGEFINKGYIDGEKALNTKKTSDDLEQFAKGESPFMLTGAWAAGRMKGLKPEFDFEIHPLPVLDDGPLLVINADTRLSVNADSEHPEAAMRFVEYFTRSDNIQKFADQQSSFSPLKSGNSTLGAELQPLVSCYGEGRTVIGTDSRLELPIWELTAEVSEKLLSGESLNAAMKWLDHQTEKEGN